MIYGDNPAKDNPKPDTNAIKQSGNLYAYCINNPVKYSDYSGESIILTMTLIGAGLGALLGGVHGHQTAKSKGYSSSDGWDYYKHVLGHGAVGAAVGGFAGWEMGTIATMAFGGSGTLRTPIRVGTATAPSVSRFVSSKLISDVGQLYDKCQGHIFSEDHRDDGILNLGISRVDIFNRFVLKINQIADEVASGSNEIRTIFEGYETTIRFYVKDGEIIKIDAFVGYSQRVLGKLFELP